MFFGGDKISPDFDLKNMILIYAKDFLWKKMDQICTISKKRRSSKSPDFNDKFILMVAKNIDGFSIYCTFISSLNHLIDHQHFNYITKLRKKNPDTIDRPITN